MNRTILSLDFYGGEITAALAALDEETDTLRIRHTLRRKVRSFSGALVRDMHGAQQEISKILSEMSEYISSTPSVVVGLRGSFLSFKRSSGFCSVNTRNNIIAPRNVEEAIQNSVPMNLSDTLDVIDILPQYYTIEGSTGIPDPRGFSGHTLEVETFLSIAPITHLTNLNNVLTACECGDYQVLPSSIAMGETMTTEAEKQAATLLLDLGDKASSAILYHHGTLLDAWELPLGMESVVEPLAKVLDTDWEDTREALKAYEIGTDDIIDDEIDKNLLQAIKKTLIYSVSYLKHPPLHLLITGSCAGKGMLKLAKRTFNVRKARIAQFENLIADCEADDPVYAGAVSLIRHALDRERAQLGVARVKENSLFGGLFNKLNELFQ